MRDVTLGRSEQSPPKYVEWAQTESYRLGLDFDGTPDTITAMIRNEQSVIGDIYLDYDVKGNLLTLPALDALLDRISIDKRVSHVFIPLRERLARPEHPLEGLQLEYRIQQDGVWIHFQDCVLPPTAIGERADIGSMIAGMVSYDQAGRFRRDLAEKMIAAQRNLGEQGFSIGGRAPFFLQRWLVDPQGNPVRMLQDGEYVRMPGHHVVWLPKEDGSLELAKRIVGMLEEMPASRVAKLLTREGIASPDAGRSRKDRGVRHKVSGAWHPNTLTNIVRGMTLVAEMVYGRRSLGDQKRFTANGART